jgi:hypothetical protein
MQYRRKESQGKSATGQEDQRLKYRIAERLKSEEGFARKEKLGAGSSEELTGQFNQNKLQGKKKSQIAALS